MASISELLLGTHWLVPIGIYVVFTFVGLAWLRKYLANQPDQVKRIFINFTFCAAIAVVFALLTDNLRFAAGTFIMMGVGVLNGIANIVHWRANKVSMSKTSLLSFGDDVVAILLAVIIVGDGAYLNWVSGTGMMLCLLTGVLFWKHHFKGGEPSAFYMNVFAYSVLWGVCDFSLRYYAIERMPVAQFLLGWYTGAWITIGLVFFYQFFRQEKRISLVQTLKLPWREVALLSVFAVGIMTALSIEYWARMLAPQTVVQPILLIAEAIVPTIVGILVFKESGTFDQAEKVFALIGIIGTVLLAVGFQN